MNEQLPFVSVVIPMRNEQGHIGECLRSVLAQDYPAERMEVLVVDGDSDDASVAEVRETAGDDPRVRVLRNPARIVPTALNIAIRAARGDVIARVDGHTRIAPDYLRRGVEVLCRTGADNVGGPMRPVGGGRFGDAVARAMCSRFGIGAYFHYGTEVRDADTVYMGMWPRAAFEKFGGFDEELVRNQDDEFNYRIRSLGGRVRFTPAMRSWYQNRTTFRALARQFYQYGLWKVRVLQKHPARMSWRHAVPPLFVVAVATTSLAALWLPAAGTIAAALIGVYALSVLAVSGYVVRDRPRLWLSTALAFATIHLAWGVGFLSGLVRFARAGREAERGLRGRAPSPVSPRDGKC